MKMLLSNLVFVVVIIIINVHCWCFCLGQTLSSPNNNGTSSMDGSLEDKFNSTAVNITYKIQDLAAQSNDFIPRFRLSSLKTPQRFMPLHDSLKPVTSAPVPQHYYTQFYAENPLLTLTKLQYSNIARFLIPQIIPNTQPTTENNENILGSGDFSVIRGGTFYPPEEMPYHLPQQNDYYYSDTSINEGSTSSADLVHKFTPHDEQFKQFHDFADLSAPNMESDFTKYVVVYTANQTNKTESNNKTNNHHNHYHYPENIYEQLLQIDEEKKRKLSNSFQGHNKNKLKLLANKLSMKKSNYNLYHKQLNKIDDKDPLLALS